MPKIITKAGTVQCSHGGTVKASKYSSKVKINGQGVAVKPKNYTVSGCSNPPPPANVGPCQKATWSTAAEKVKAEGDPVLLDDSKATTTPAGTDAIVQSAHGGSAKVEAK